jgi:hypothetical protein
MENTTMETTLPQNPTEQETPELPSINVQDLIVLRSCIQVAAQRGAFRAEEMQNVGKAFDKLDAFLKYVETPQDLTTKADGIGHESVPVESQQGE